MKKILPLLCVSVLLFSCADEKYEEPEMPPVPEYRPDAPTSSTLTVTFEDGVPVVEKTKLPGVTCEVNGSHLTINNENVTEEYTFNLSGTSIGSITYIGAYKCKFVLEGLNLTSESGAALDIQCGKRVDLILTDDTENSLVDAAGGEQKAALYCKGHLEIGGGGTLTVNGKSKHGISTKEYLQLKRSFTGSIVIAEAVSDALHVGQYFKMNGGSVKFDVNTKGDGVQVETITLDDEVTPDPEEEDNGKILINGGNIEGIIAGEDCKGLKCDDLVLINGGTITLTAQGNGSRGIQTKSNMEINEESADIPTVINITAKGRKCSEEDAHRCNGIKVEKNLKVTGGVTVVSTPSASTTKARAIRVGTYTKTGGSVTGTIYEDE